MNGDFLSRPQPAGDRFAERRSTPRYFLIAEIEVWDPIQQTKFTACTAEIGAHGCYVRVGTPLPRNTVIQVHIVRRGGMFKAWGRVAHSQDGVGMGIAFFRPEPNYERTLLIWVAELAAHEKCREAEQTVEQESR